MCLSERERDRGQTSINSVYLNYTEQSYKAYQFGIPVGCAALLCTNKHKDNLQLFTDWIVIQNLQ